MESHLWLEISVIVLLILANGFFALSEFSIIASRKSKLLQKVEEGKMGAETATKLHANPESFLATIQVGITLVGALVGVVSGATIVEKLEQRLLLSEIPFLVRFASAIAVGTIVFLITSASVIVGELVPKYIALSYPERFARLVAGPMNLFYRTTYVFAQSLSKIARVIVQILGIKKNAESSIISEEEIEHILVEGREKGLFDPTEEEFIKKVFEFTDSTVRRAMKPRTDVIGIDITETPDDIMKTVFEHGYSRYPVYENSLDRVVGVLYTKDLMIAFLDLPTFDLKKYLREPMFVPDSMPLSRVLKDFQRGKMHLAIVLDEYGGTAGIVSLEDILEELVGEIQDEYDAEAPPVAKLTDTVAHADGSVWPGEINRLLDTDLPEEEEKTLAGLVFDELGYVPERYESVTVSDVRLTVLAKDKNRIMRVKAEKLVPPDEDGE